MATSTYIHIPFCKKRCNYCSFVSNTSTELKNEYLQALEAEIKSNYQGESQKTIYFGGGTPSLLSAQEFENIIGLFNLETDCEITAEVNPEKSDAQYYHNLKNAGVNRLSIGCQSFDDRILKSIGRIHDSNDISLALNAARTAGFENIGIDLIYGLPSQSLNDFENDLKRAVNSDIRHISLYGLKIEEGCIFFDNTPQNLPDEDLQADMYLKALGILRNSGFNHYEISNFSKEGFESRHNLNYWNNKTYYGFGAGACGYLKGIRYSNECDLKKYINNPDKKATKEPLTSEQVLEEAIFLGFRKIAGINTEQINKDFAINFDNKYKLILQKYIKSGHIKKTPEGYALTDKGILVSNDVLLEYINFS